MGRQVTEPWTIKGCPACGSPVETEWTYDGAYDVCEYCGWDDYVDHRQKAVEIEVVLAK